MRFRPAEETAQPSERLAWGGVTAKVKTPQRRITEEGKLAAGMVVSRRKTACRRSFLLKDGEHEQRRGGHKLLTSKGHFHRSNCPVWSLGPSMVCTYPTQLTGEDAGRASGQGRGRSYQTFEKTLCITVAKTTRAFPEVSLGHQCGRWIQEGGD